MTTRRNSTSITMDFRTKKRLEQLRQHPIAEGMNYNWDILLNSLLDTIEEQFDIKIAAKHINEEGGEDDIDVSDIYQGNRG